MYLSFYKAADAAAKQADATIAYFGVADTNANILAALPQLALDSKLYCLQVSDAAAFTVNAALYGSYQVALDRLFYLQSMVVTGASVAKAATAQLDRHVSSFTLTDTAASVLGNLKLLSADTKLASISLTDASSLGVDGATYKAYARTLDLLSPGQSLLLSGVAAGNAAAAQADLHVSGFSVSDTAANVLANLPALSLDAKLGSITLQGGSLLALGADAYTAYRGTVDKLASGFTASVTGLPVANAALAQADGHVSSFTVRDTAANILGNLGTLSLDSHLTSFLVSDSTVLNVSAAQFATYHSTLDKLGAGETLAVSGLTVANAASAQADSHVGSFVVADTAAHILAGLPTLATESHLAGLQVTDTNTLNVDGSTFFAYRATLDKLVSGETLSVTGLSAARAALAQADSHVASFTVNDSKAMVLANLTVLNADTHLTGITLTEGGALGLTAAQYAADAAVVAKLASVTVSGVAADAAATVAKDAHVSSLSVNDTLGHIGSSLASLEALAKAGKVTEIHVADSGQTLSLSAADSATYHDALALLTGSFQLTGPTVPNFVINLRYDASMAAAPQGFKDALDVAVQFFENLISTKETVTIAVGYGECGGSKLPAGVLGEAGPAGGLYVNFDQFKAAYAAHATSPTQLSELASMGTDPTHGGTLFVASAEAKALGLMDPQGTALDGAMGFSSVYGFSYDAANRGVAGKYDFIGVVEHELTHALGRFDFLDQAGNFYSPLDLMRYSAPGVHALNTTTNAYFSVDGGKTNLDWFSTSSDLADWASSAGYDANNAYTAGGVTNLFGATDVIEMNALGYALH